MSNRRGPRASSERVEKLLLMLPWLVQKGSTQINEMAERFNLSREDLIRDLELATLCGRPPYSPLDQIELIIDDDVVYASMPRFVERPPALTLAEGFALQTAIQVALSLPGADPNAALASAASKLSAVLSAQSESIVLDMPTPEYLEVLREAMSADETVKIQYFVPSRGEVTKREITPAQLFTDRGHWYVRCFDSKSQTVRRFRVDRIEAAKRTGRKGSPVPLDGEAVDFFDGADLDQVLLEVSGNTDWIVDNYPIESIEDVGGGAKRIRMYATSEHWLGRLLVRLGPNGKVLEPKKWQKLGQKTAKQILSRYV